MAFMEQRFLPSAVLGPPIPLRDFFSVSGIVPPRSGFQPAVSGTIQNPAQGEEMTGQRIFRRAVTGQEGQ
jgi:hypothetical protein